jgi:poly(3-hydroxybutyrate) depolymerase
LSTELTELNQLRARLESEAATMPRETLQDRTWEFNTRVRRHNQDADEFNRLVEQYNLMIAYPDGLDRARVAPRPTVAVAGAK